MNTNARPPRRRAPLAILAGIAVATLAVQSHAADAPVVLELFQSQGCSSCPPANANVNALADRPGLLALSFGVTYWDQLGWKDTFAKPEYTARQWAYAHGLHHQDVGTPQVVLNGRTDLVGVDRAELENAIRAAGRPAGAQVALAPGRATVAAGRNPGHPADVWLVRYDPRVQQVPIRRGENGGKTLPHKDIVRQLVRLGGWTGAAAAFPLPPSPDPALKTAILVQVGDGGPILGATAG